MNGTLNISTSDLHNVGNQISGTSAEVERIFEKMDAEVANVTSSNAWSGAASAAFLNKFEASKKIIREDLIQLAALGPAVQKVAQTYANAEEENVGRIG